jgi:signal transduction histidine kinase
MSRPSYIWTIFAVCFAILLGALGWITFTALQLDRAQQQAQQQAELEERVRLALWRMDSSLAPLIIEESARPASAYNAFGPAERAYTKGLTAIQQGDVLVPSPLLTFYSSNILLHFQFRPGSAVTSPQVPSRDQRSLAKSDYLNADQLSAAAKRLTEFQALLSQPVTSLSGLPAASATTSATARSTTLASDNGDLLIQSATIATNLSAAQTIEVLANAPAQWPGLNGEALPQQQKGQEYRNQIEQNARASVFQSAQQRLAINNSAMANPAPTVTSRVMEGLFTPVWLGSELVLVRRVDLGGDFVVQGCWLNWSHLKSSLLENIRDLLPGADLQPFAATTGILQPRVLAALPVKLVAAPAGPAPAPALTPARVSLLVAWACIAMVGLAVVVLIHGILSLSERRAAFVSAVTHELRTPLTTFKMYSEMLAEDMVPDAGKRKQYLATLCSEANRLGHLVENVLAYARLERGSARGRIEQIPLAALIETVKPRLEQRAGQAGMTLVVDADATTLGTAVHVDASVVEQILFNLVDNACKYAAPAAAEKIIHLEALPGGRFAMLRVRDHGRGITAAGAKRLFQPFSKSAHEAAHTAPGVGLGLALCRRLSRSMGGDLHLDALVENGACFVLSLPRCPADGRASVA